MSIKIFKLNCFLLFIITCHTYWRTTVAVLFVPVKYLSTIYYFSLSMQGSAHLSNMHFACGKDTQVFSRVRWYETKPNCLWFDQWQHMLLNAAITDLKLHAFSLVQTTIGFCKLCRTGSPVYHVVFNHVFSRFFGEKLLCPWVWQGLKRRPLCCQVNRLTLVCLFVYYL